MPLTPPPVFMVLRELGPTLTWFGLGLLGIGATLTALFIFRPAHKRLQTLEQAARALGEGRTDVRADEAGGDEVSSLARTFNRMAADLDSRAQALAASDRDAPAAARRRVARADDAVVGDARLHRDARRCRRCRSTSRTRRRYLGIVEQETHKLEAIIGDLLDLARLEGGGDNAATGGGAGHGPLQPRRRSPRADVERAHITLDVEVAPGTPTVRGDAARLEQALQNLAANAMRHTPAGGRVTLRAEAAGEGVRITVHDTGPGIPPEHLPRIFDRFYKVDAARAGTAVPSGSGLGLSIVQAIVSSTGDASARPTRRKAGRCSRWCCQPASPGSPRFQRHRSLVTGCLLRTTAAEEMTTDYTDHTDLLLVLLVLLVLCVISAHVEAVRQVSATRDSATPCSDTDEKKRSERGRRREREAERVGTPAETAGVTAERGTVPTSRVVVVGGLSTRFLAQPPARSAAPTRQRDMLPFSRSPVD